MRGYTWKRGCDYAHNTGLSRFYLVGIRILQVEYLDVLEAHCYVEMLYSQERVG